MIDTYQESLFDELLRQRRRVFEPAVEPVSAGNFLLSAPRSGSTLLRAILSGAPEIQGLPEHGLLHFESVDELGDFERLGAGVRSLGYKAVVESLNLQLSPRARVTDFYRALSLNSPNGWLEKSTSYAVYSEILERIERDFSQPKYVILKRERELSISSFARMGFEKLFFSGRHPFRADELAELIWDRSYRNLESLPSERCLRVSYESLIADPSGVVSDICSFLGLSYSDKLLDPWSEAQDRLLVQGCGDPNFWKHTSLKKAVSVANAAVQAPTTLFELFAQNVQRYPDRVCLGDWTYQELAKRVESMAGWLREELVPKSRLVALNLTKNRENLALILACLKLGLAYLPLDKTWPKARRQSLVDLAKPDLVVESVPKPSKVSEAPTVCAATDTAYVLFTSGSTGQPKGVKVSQGAAAEVVQAQIELFGVNQKSVVLQAAPWTFDTSVVQIFMALGAGAELVLPEETMGLHEWGALVHRVTHLDMTPSHLKSLPDSGYPKLEVVSSGGEHCDLSLVQRFASGRRFFHCYGTTETAICNLVSECFSEQSWQPTLGKPLAGSRVYLLDEQLQPVRLGELGEIVIGGSCLADGYLDGSLERFPEDPFRDVPGARMFRTGDLGRINGRGEIVFEGRADRQLNLQGRRVDPAEIEAVMKGHHQVSESFVRAEDDRLVAYFVGAVEDLRSFLSERLPSAMIPSELVKLERLPRASSGKIDPSRLQRPQTGESGSDGWVSKVWREVLGVSQGNFFDLGGSSLDLLNLQRKLEDKLGKPLEVSLLFRYPDPHLLEKHLSEDPVAGGKPPVKNRPRRSRRRGSVNTVLQTRKLRIMSPPEYFSVKHTINPWMEGVEPVEKALAQEQWEGLRDLLMELGQEVRIVSPTPGLPDMTFAADCGLAIDSRFLVSRFCHAERKPEAEVYAEWFRELGFSVTELGTGEVWEGLGDIVVSPRGLIFGQGPRSTAGSVNSLTRAFPEVPMLAELEISDERFYHTASALAVLDGETALSFLPAFAPESQAKLRSLFPKLLEVSEDDALQNFACNCLRVEDTLIMAGCSSSLREQLEPFGLEVRCLDLSEYRKSGAGPRCLVLDTFALC